MTAPMSPIEGDNNNEAPTPLALGSRNPFLASIIAQRQTPSTWRDPTTSGTLSNRSTKRSLVQNELSHGSFDEQMSRPEQTGSIGGHGRTWNTSSQPVGEPPSISVPPQTGNSWQESTPIATGSYTAPTLVDNAQIYGHEQRRSTDSSRETPLPRMETGRVTPLGGQPVRHSPTTGTPSSQGIDPKMRAGKTPGLWQTRPQTHSNTGTTRGRQ